jgi:hypothetical protein
MSVGCRAEDPSLSDVRTAQKHKCSLEVVLPMLETGHRRVEAPLDLYFNR